MKNDPNTYGYIYDKNRENNDDLLLKTIKFNDIREIKAQLPTKKNYNSNFLSDNLKYNKNNNNMNNKHKYNNNLYSKNNEEILSKKIKANKNKQIELEKMKIYLNKNHLDKSKEMTKMINLEKINLLMLKKIMKIH